MGKASQLREVYAELRAALGDEFPAHEVLDLASRLVAAAGHVALVDCTRGAERPDYWSVDETIHRCGWMLVEDARRAGMYDDDDQTCVDPLREFEEAMRMAA